MNDEEAKMLWAMVLTLRVMVKQLQAEVEALAKDRSERGGK